MQEKIWFEGTIEIQCSMKQVEQSTLALGQHYLEIVRMMPGLTSVELIDEGEDFVTIKTNEGMMKRSNIRRIAEESKITLEFHEEYHAGKMVTSNADFTDEFIKSERGVLNKVSIKNLTAPGFLGFIYKTFGSSNIGKAFLKTNKNYLEKCKTAEE